ncbi:AraC family transcriptional regulator [Xenophilus aerolatus]|nr:AraC family transcriptional regulator [Xenophilus aerolatus]
MPTTPLPTFLEFEAESLAAGFDEVLERVWPPGAVLDTHRHPFGVSALVVQGTLWLGCEGATRELHAGDRFTLDADVPHDERYGDEGATYWVARKNAT